MKKLLLSIFIPIAGLPVFAQSETTDPSASLDFTVGGITYTILNEQEKTCQTKAGYSTINYEDRKLVFIYGNSISGDITIPASVQKPSDTNGSSADNTYTVVAIGSYGFDKASTVTIEPGGVTSIGDYAFLNDTSLTSISIPDDVTYIGRSAFYYCTNISNITLPRYLTSIESFAFSYTSLTSVAIPENVISIGESAFAYCSSLQSVVIPGNVVQIGKSVFQNCNALISLTLQEGLSSIPAYAFSGCNALTTLTIPSSVSSIGDYGFYGSGLTSITCLNRTIPAISSNSFTQSTYSNTILNVYKTSLQSYQNSKLWGQFKNIEPIQLSTTGIAISPSTLNINVGLTGQLSATLTPVDATDDITWQIVSTNPTNCIELDDNGLVTARQIGTASVSASSGDQTAVCDVIVNANPDESVVITPPVGDIFIGDIITLSAVVFPTTITPSLSWSSSNPSVATIDPQSGVLTALADGATVITATNDNVSGTLALTINPIAVSSISLDQQNVTLKVGGSQTLSATVLPENATYKNVSWDSNDPSVVVVADGVLTAMGVGTANVRAMAGQETANCIVTVEPIEAESITLSATNVALKIGQSLQLSATVMPENTTDKAITWVSSNSACAPISTDGEIRAISQGTTTITATCGTISATCLVTVNPIESEEVVLNFSALTLKVGSSQQLTATIYPSNTTDQSLSWSSSSASIATVEGGLVTAVAPGTATITVSNGTKSAICTVVVEPIPVEQIILKETSITINTGSPYTLNVSIIPDNATFKTVEWSSLNPDIATVSNGVVTGVNPGNTVITASNGNANASCTVTVLQPATSISLNKTNLDLFVGDIFDLIETVMPANTTDAVTWYSSNANVATVDNNGIVSAIKAGSATITVTCGQKTASCVVTVSDIMATSVTLDYTALNLITGQTQQLSATILPANTTFPIVTWKSSDISVATVSEDGTVAAVAPGNAVITATCGEVSGTCAITVTAPAPTEVVLNYQTYSLKASETIQLQVINPAGINATDITWTSSNNSVAIVANNGIVTALAVGEATVKASYNGLEASCIVTVAPTYAETVVLNATDLTLNIEETYQLLATVSPETTTDSTVIWTSSNPDVVAVSEDGEITALSAGVSTIIAECGQVYATCLVTVLEEEVNHVENIDLSENDGYYRVYNIQGASVMITKEKADLNRLQPGIYIINRKKVIIR